MNLKTEALQTLLNQLAAEWNSLAGSARAAHEAATHEESRAEDRHDTFAIEASYLAAGQSARVLELERTRAELEGYLSSTHSSEKVELGCLIEYETEEGRHLALISNLGGGSRAVAQGLPVQVLSATSPLGEELMGLRAGEEAEIERKGVIRSYRVLSIR